MSLGEGHKVREGGRVGQCEKIDLGFLEPKKGWG